jgi:hypothetical protein
VCIGWAFFRAESVEDCWIIIKGLFALTDFNLFEWHQSVLGSGWGNWVALLSGVIGVGLFVQMKWPSDSHHWIDWIWKQPLFVRTAFVVLCLYCTLILSLESAPPFIYFQF